MAGEPRGSLFYFESPGTPSEPFSLQDGNPSSPLLGAGVNPGAGNEVPDHDFDGNALFWVAISESPPKPRIRDFRIPRSVC